MKIYLDKNGRVVKQEQTGLVANAFGGTQATIQVYFENSNVTYATISFIRADNRRLTNFTLIKKVDVDGLTYYEKVINEDDHILDKKGVLQISCQFIHSETKNGQEVKTQVIPSVLFVDYVLENIGGSEEEYNAFIIALDTAIQDLNLQIDADINAHNNNVLSHPSILGALDTAIEDLNSQMNADIDTHNNDEKSHPYILNYIKQLEDDYKDLIEGNEYVANATNSTYAKYDQKGNEIDTTYATKNELPIIDDEMSDTSENTVQNKVIKAYVDTHSGNVDLSDYYNKEETDNLLDGKVNVGNVFTKDEEVELLSKKANKAETYTKTETDSKFATKQFVEEENQGKKPTYVVQSLDNIASLFTIEDAGDGEHYTLTKDGKQVATGTNILIKDLGVPDYWVSELYTTSNDVMSFLSPLETTKVDLSDYDTKEEVDEKVDAKQDILISGTNIKTINGESVLGSGDIEIITDLSNYYTKKETNDLLDEKVDKVDGKQLSTNDYSNADKNIVSNVTTNLDLKANKTDIPTKTSELTNDSNYQTETQVQSLINSAIISGLGEDY